MSSELEKAVATVVRDCLGVKPGELRILPTKESVTGTTSESRYSDAAARTVAIWDIPNPAQNRIYRYAVECVPLTPRKVSLRMTLIKVWKNWISWTGRD